MAHEIEGNYAFFNKTPAWHKLGTVLTDAPSVKAAWSLAYPHVLYKLPTMAKWGEYSADGKTFIQAYDDNGKPVTLDLEEGHAIVRDDGKEIGRVGKDFGLIQPSKVFEGFEPMVEAGLVELEAGGSLCDGKRMWALGKIKGADADILRGDPIRGYVLFYTGFDGSLSVGLMRTSVRVVCANTLAMAMNGQNTSNGFKLRHTSNVEKRFEAAADTIMLGLQGFKHDVEVYQALAAKKLTRTQQERVVLQAIVPKIVEARDQGKEVEIPAQTETKIRTVLELLDTQTGLELVPAMRGTAWQAYNAVSEYLTHDYGRTPDSRLNGQWFGESATMNKSALNLALAA